MADILGNNIGAPAVPFTTDDDYPTHYAQYGNGGVRTVADQATRNAITTKRREWRMIVRYLDGSSFELVPGHSSMNLADNGNWRAYPWFAAGAVGAGSPAGSLLDQLQWLRTNSGGGPANQMPIAAAGTDVSIVLPVDSVQLDGSGTDPDGTVTGYLWSQMSGPTTATLTNAATATATVSALAAGVYVFRLTVTDNAGGTDTDDVTVTVQAAAGTPVITTITPNMLWDDGSVRTQGGQHVPNPYSYAKIQLPAGQTSVEVEVACNIVSPNFTQIAYRGNGAWSATYPVTPMTTAWYTITGLPAGALFEPMNGYLQAGNPDLEGVVIRAVRTVGAPTVLYPTPPAKLIVAFGNSITNGPSDPFAKAHWNRLRRDADMLAAGWRIINESYSGRALEDDFTDEPAARAALVARLAGLYPEGCQGIFWDAMVTNSPGILAQTAAAFLARKAAFVDAFHAAAPTVVYKLQKCLLRTFPGNAPGATDEEKLQVYADINAGYDALAATRPWLKVVTINITEPDVAADGLHPDWAAHETKMYPQTKAELLSTDPEPEPEPVYVEQLGYVPFYLAAPAETPTNDAVTLKQAGVSWTPPEQSGAYFAEWGFYTYNQKDAWYSINFRNLPGPCGFRLPSIVSQYGGNIELLLDGEVVATANTHNPGATAGKRVLLWTLVAGGADTEVVPMPNDALPHVLTVRQAATDPADGPGDILSYDSPTFVAL